MMYVMIPLLILTIFLIVYIQMTIQKAIKARHNGVDLTKKNRFIALLTKLFARTIFDG